MSLFRAVARRRRSVVSIAGLTTVAVGITTMAFLYEGLPSTTVDLNDGGIWVTKSSDLLVGHLNFPSRVLDSGLRTKAPEFDVLQNGNDVLVHDSAANTLTRIDTANVALRGDGTLPAGAAVTFGGGTVAVVAGGKLYGVAVGEIDGLSLKGAKALATIGKDGSAAVGTDGVIHAVSPTSGTILTVAPTDAGGFTAPTSSSLGTIPDGAAYAITAVGAQAVVLDTAHGVLTLPDGKTATVEDGAGGVLQQSGAASGTVAVATPTALVSQPLDGSASSSTTVSKGTPSAPVALNGCTYGVWSGSGEYVRDCARNADDQKSTVKNASANANLVLRTNRDVVVVNDSVGGTVWLISKGMARVDNWTDIVPPSAPDASKSDDADDQQQVTLPKRNDKNTPPTAVDDTFGARPGRATILPVLENDSDPDGDLLSVALVGSAPGGLTVDPVVKGSELQVTVPATATGSPQFRYRVSDGRGGTAEATVTLQIRSTGNAAPEQKRRATVKVEAGSTVTTDALQGWIDPDGDALFLAGATAKTDPDLKYRSNGLVTYTASTTGIGVQDVEVTVSDGTATATGILEVDVRAGGTLQPIANADRVSAVAGVPVTIDPLVNDVSPSGGTLRLAKVDTVTGATATGDFTAGTILFTAAKTGVYYLQYLVSDGPGSGVGLIRVDVAAGTGKTAAPVAAADIARLPVGRDIVVDVLDNDTDPSGGILVVQSVTVPQGAGIAVQILQHQLVRVTDTSNLSVPVTFQYTVSNGVKTAVGQVTVLPVPLPAKLRPPVAVDDSASVRAGDVVTIDVLDNDYDPDGDTLTLVPTLVAPLPAAAEGTAFVSEGKLRFKAGSTAGTAHVTYEVSDSQGNKTAAYVTIQITAKSATNSPPTPLPVTGRVLAGSTVRIPVPLDGIDQDGDSVQLVGAATAPTKGRVTVGTGWLTYEAYPDTTGRDSFTYSVRDSRGATATGSVEVGIAAPSFSNQAPYAVKDAVDVRPGRAVSVAVLANDSDPDGDDIHLVTGGLTVPSGVSAKIAGDRVVVTAPSTAGSFTVQYTIADSFGAETTGALLVTVTATAPLVVPIARDDYVDALSIDTGKPVRVDVLANDEDPDGTADDLKVTVAGTSATVSGKQVVVPVATASQIVTYTVTDPDGLEASAFVFVPGTSSVLPTLSSADPITVTSGKALTLDLEKLVKVRADHTPRISVAASVTAAHSNGQKLIASATALTYTSAANYYGPDAVSVEVTDGTGPDDPKGLSSFLSIPILVIPATNQSPTLLGTAVTVAPGEGSVSLDLAKLSRDPNPGDLAKLSYKVTRTPAKITAAVKGTTLTVGADDDADTGASGSVTIQVSDGTSKPTTGTITVGVVKTTKPLAMANDDVIADAKQGQKVTVRVLANDYNPFPKDLTLLSASVDGGTGTAVVSGSDVVVTPGAKFVGLLTVSYRVADATGTVDRQVVGHVKLTVQGVPDSPGTPQVTSIQDRTVVLSWTPPSNNGSPITGYTVKSSKGYAKECASTTCTLDGLTNNVSYTFTVTATNGVGDSPASRASGSARPDARPNAPGTPTLKFGDKKITATWAAATSTGSPVTSYTVEVSGDGGYQKTVKGTSAVLTGLVNGSSYTVRVQATNKAPEPSDWSAPSAPEIPAGVPTAPGVPKPMLVTGVGSQAQIQVDWAASERNGDNVSTYTVNTYSGGSLLKSTDVPGTETQATIALATSTSKYTFAVTARNKAGKSPTSARSQEQQAANAPDAPTRITNVGNDGSVIVVVTPGTLNGNNPSDIQWHYASGSATGVFPRGTNSYTVPNLQNGTSYQFTVYGTTSVNADTSKGGSTTAPNATIPIGQPVVGTVTATSQTKAVHFTWSIDPAGASDVSVTVTRGGAVVATGGVGLTSYDATGLGDGQQVSITVTVVTAGASGHRSASGSGSGTSTAPHYRTWVTRNGNTLTYHWTDVPAGSWPEVSKFRCYDVPPNTQQGTVDIVGVVDGSITAGNGSVSVSCPGATDNYSIEPWKYGPWLKVGTEQNG